MTAFNDPIREEVFDFNFKNSNHLLLSPKLLKFNYYYYNKIS